MTESWNSVNQSAIHSRAAFTKNSQKHREINDHDPVFWVAGMGIHYGVLLPEGHRKIVHIPLTATHYGSITALYAHDRMVLENMVNVESHPEVFASHSDVAVEFDVCCCRITRLLTIELQPNINPARVHLTMIR